MSETNINEKKIKTSIKNSIGKKFLSIFEKFRRTYGKLIEKIVCVFDDIPVVLKGTLPASMESIGSFMLAGVSFITFPIEIYEGVRGIKKALKLDKTDPKRKLLMETNLSKIGMAITGFGTAVALLVVTILAVAIVGPILSLAIPVIMTGIHGVEFRQKLKSYRLAQAMPAGPEKEAALVKTKRGLIYSSIYLGLMGAITILASFGTIAGLGLASFGIIPSALLIGVVALAFSIKLFQLIDKHYNFKYTAKIKDFFRKIIHHPKVKQTNTNDLIDTKHNLNEEQIKLVSSYEKFIQKGLLNKNSTAAYDQLNNMLSVNRDKNQTLEETQALVDQWLRDNPHAIDEIIASVEEGVTRTNYDVEGLLKNNLFELSALTNLSPPDGSALSSVSSPVLIATR